MKLFRFFLIIFILVSVPLFARAELFISEIMYNPKGVDKNRDWVEICNNGNAPFEILSYPSTQKPNRLTLKLKVGSKEKDSYSSYYLDVIDTNVIKNNSCVIAVNNIEDFKREYTYSGILFGFTSELSLPNTSYTDIILENKDGEFYTSINYDPSLFGITSSNEENFSIQKNSSGDWVAGLPTPGVGASGFSSGTTESVSGIQPDVVAKIIESSSNTTGDFSYGQNTSLNSVIRLPNIGAVGSNIVFDGRALNSKKEDVIGARFVWSFGDGATSEGQSVSHIYKYAGKYVVFLDTYFGELKSSARAEINLINAEIVISNISNKAGGSISIENKSLAEVDLSGWKIETGGYMFSIPLHTIVLSRTVLTFGGNVLGFVPVASNARIIYPDGTTASYYDPNTTKKPVLANVSVKNSDLEPQNALGQTIKEVSVKDRSNQNTELKNDVKEVVPVASVVAEKTFAKTSKNDSLTASILKVDENLSVGKEVFVGENGGSSILKWFGIFLGIIAIVLSGLFFIGKRKQENFSDKAKIFGSDYEIIEEK